MKMVRSPPLTPSKKARTYIPGFDEITGGGLPRGRTTLLEGGPGSGKTIFGMQFLVNAAMNDGEPGIFVAFEETSKRIITNVAGFDWPLAELQKKKLFFMDAQPVPDMIEAGDFDLTGMLTALAAKAKAMGAKRIVFDALDIVLAFLPDHMAKRREVFRLHEWLLLQGLTGLITGKVGGEDSNSAKQLPFNFMQFMVDCAIVLNHTVARGVSQRNLRVQKYRGSAFDENEAPFVIGKTGFIVATSGGPRKGLSYVGQERVSSGVKRLDTMLGGGYFRGASVLITGFPGTAKTTLSAAFAQAACKRGERTTFVSFDSDGGEVIRNLTSVGIKFRVYAENGTLNMISARTMVGSAETLLVRIKQITTESRSRCLVIDPVSTFARSGNEITSHGVAERLIDWCKADGITLVCTSLLDEQAGQTEAGTPLQISTLADTWIHLNYLVQSGERNRGMSIIKSRGTSHSNQVRELILSDQGITLADIYAARGEVLMGTLRWEKERAEQLENEVGEVGDRLKSVRLGAEYEELQVRLKSIHTEILAKQVEKTLLARTTQSRVDEHARRDVRLRKLRRGDSVHTGEPVQTKGRGHA
jgi:circadian clock protein KaiC